MFRSLFCRLILLPAVLLSLTACSGKEEPRPLDEFGPAHESSMSWRETWKALSYRLQKDGIDAEKTAKLFERLDTPPSLAPMGAKVRELYSAKYLPKPKEKPQKKQKPKKKPADKLGIPGPWFDGVVTKANAQKCLDFIDTHRTAFMDAERRYAVPAEIAAALLFVETRLGTFLGSEKAFYSLASMSVTRSPRSMVYYLDDLPGMRKHLGWVRVRMDEKAEWAYKELKALLVYCFENGIDPYNIPGSRYGAIGMCQFMPSNLPLFAADGDHDGIINIFTAPDAIASLSNYLSENGWRRNMPLNAQVNVLMRYNKMKKYAYTILALAKTIEELEKSRPHKR